MPAVTCPPDIACLHRLRTLNEWARWIHQSIHKTVPIKPCYLETPYFTTTDRTQSSFHQCNSIHTHKKHYQSFQMSYTSCLSCLLNHMPAQTVRARTCFFGERLLSCWSCWPPLFPVLGRLGPALLQGQFHIHILQTIFIHHIFVQSKTFCLEIPCMMCDPLKYIPLNTFTYLLTYFY